jgi:7-dehydrocholesterol reductase
LLYNINGLQAFFATLAILGVLYYFSIIDAAIVHREIGPLIVVTNVAGVSIVILLYIKGRISPTNSDTVAYGHHSFVYDICMGIELNPRIGNFDLKLFFIARCGMISWILVDLSHAAGQYERFGEVTNAMVLVCVLHSFYVIDLLYYEAWYLETIDIMHDRLGFNLTYGVIVYVPFGYTFQTWYLSHNPIALPAWQFYLILTVGIFAYYLFRSSNNQRRQFRAAKGKINIWGKPAKFIRAKYATGDGKESESLLLTSGWWGLARHFNYTADLIGSFCYCVPCGFHDFMPWWYFVFMTWLLNHRGNRDNQRCGVKYGKYWQQYCKEVPYKLIPYVY